MGFRDAIGRMESAVFDRLGEDATWTGVVEPVRVRRREADEELQQTYGEIVATGRSIRVRKSEVDAPAEGDEVQILDDDGNPVAGAAYTVTGEPELDRTDVWTCKVILA